MRRLFLLALITLPALSQTQYDTGAIFSASYNVALSSSAGVLTLQMPASGAPRVQFLGLSVTCSAACTFTIEANGTAASSTPLTIRNVNPSNPNARSTLITAWSNSNVGVGTVIKNYRLDAAGTMTFNMQNVQMQGNGTSVNYTIRSNSFTGQFVVNVDWAEI